MCESENVIRWLAIAGTLVTIASATDDDADENAMITYSIANAELPFDIDSFNGEVRCLRVSMILRCY